MTMRASTATALFLSTIKGFMSISLISGKSITKLRKLYQYFLDKLDDLKETHDEAAFL